MAAPNLFTERFSLKLPIALAPMAMASGGALAAACARSGILGLVGGGYGDVAWTSREYDIAVNTLSGDGPALARLGCGFISWKLAEDDTALRWLLENHEPAAIMLSFGDPRPFGARVKAAGVALICQIHNMDDLPIAVEAGADIIIAQGTEAGGHGATWARGRGTMSFVPEVADWLQAHRPETPLLAAGGIGDGRGVAAAMMLGADGVVMGSRFWAAEECLADKPAKEFVIPINGSGTTRSPVFDILRRKNWPGHFDFRAVRNKLHRTWEDRIDALRDAPEEGRLQYDEGVAQGDYQRAHIGLGESIGLIHDVPTAADLIERTAAEMEKALHRV